MPHKRTPQEKKQKSLQSDGRNRYGENSKASRKGIRSRKSGVNRSYRHAVKEVLAEPHTNADALEERAKGVPCRRWKKSPDTALGDVLLDNLTAQLVARVSAAPDPDQVLDQIESHLIKKATPCRAIQYIMQQLRTAVGSRNSTWPTIDYNTAARIISFLNRHEM